MDDNTVNDDTSNIDLTLDIDSGDDVDVAALQEQNKKLYARAKKAEGFTQQSDGSWVKAEKPQNITQPAEVKPYNILEDEVADLILEGYTKEETRFVLANGGRKALEDSNSFVAAAIHAKREQARAEKAAGETTQGGYSFQGGKSYSEEQLRNMSPEEMEKVLPRA